jgi:hypothetical protein
MKQIVLATLVGSILFARDAHACSCAPTPPGFLSWGSNKVPRNLVGFPWYGGAPTDAAWLPPEAAFHLTRVRPGKPPEPLAFTLERSDSVFPDRTIPEFLLGKSVIHDGLLHTKDQQGRDMVWPRRVIVLLRPATPLLPGSTYQLTYDRGPAVDDFGERLRDVPPQKIRFTVDEDGIAMDGNSASILVGEEEVRSLAVTARRGRCSTGITAASLSLDLVLPAGMRKWRDFFLYSTLVDGRGWRPAPNNCLVVRHGTSWVGRGRDLVYATCSGETPTDNLSEGTHTVEMEAWLPGTKTVVRAKTSVTLTCDRRPTRR